MSGSSLAREAVVPRLRGRFGRPYLYVQQCSSTQRLFAGDEPEGAVAVADEQTEGRGRLGRRWLAPPGTSLLCSVVFRPSVHGDRLPELSLVAGAACAESIREVTGVEPTIKAPNDVLVGGRKIAGVLAEASEGRVVVGIGINVNIPEAELPVEGATSLLVETGAPVDRAELLVTLLDRLERAYNAWVGEAVAYLG